MPLRVSLRMGEEHAPFRHMLYSLIKSIKGGRLVLCSGYIWEPNNGSNSVLDDGLFQAIQDGKPEKITVIAGKLQGEWKNRYINFVKRLQEEFDVRPYIAKKRNWHAKIALRLKNGKPFAGIIGSSNLTSPALREMYPRWNFEGDVLIWIDQKHYNDLFFRSSDVEKARNSRGYGTFFLELTGSVEQPSEEDQLRRIYELIRESELELLDI